MEYENQNLSRIIDTAKRVISFSYTDNRIAQVNIPPSRHLRFAYTTDGFLSKVWDMRGNYHRYVYRNQNLFAMLIEIYQTNVDFDSSIRPRLQIIYDDHYRVIKQHTAHSLTVDSPGFLFNWATPQTLFYKDPTGKGATFSWNDYGQVYKVIPFNYPSGTEKTISYAATHGPKSIMIHTYKDAKKNIYTYSYQDDKISNSPDQIYLPDKRFLKFTYNSTNDLISLKTPEGLNADYILNNYGKPESINIIGADIPSVIHTKASYLSDGDHQGQIQKISDDDHTRYEIVSRSIDGQPLETKHYISKNEYLTTKYMYDSAGRLVSKQDNRGTYTCFYYDNNDNLIDLIQGLTKACSLAPASVSVRRSHFDYDAQNRLIQSTNGYGGEDPFIVRYH
ncbi:hypothetical protein MHK_006399 [Candidatus Magnetomorum sp. HK-1]|nr:hypothetical protein MHK_006399 [Candidatus Magnetomorum sp. HK-1]